MIGIGLDHLGSSGYIGQAGLLTIMSGLSCGGSSRWGDGVWQPGLRVNGGGRLSCLCCASACRLLTAASVDRPSYRVPGWSLLPYESRASVCGQRSVHLSMQDVVPSTFGEVWTSFHRAFRVLCVVGLSGLRLRWIRPPSTGWQRCSPHGADPLVGSGLQECGQHHVRTAYSCVRPLAARSLCGVDVCLAETCHRASTGTGPLVLDWVLCVTTSILPLWPYWSLREYTISIITKPLYDHVVDGHLVEQMTSLGSSKTRFYYNLKVSDLCYHSAYSQKCC